MNLPGCADHVGVAYLIRSLKLTVYPLQNTFYEDSITWEPDGNFVGQAQALKAVAP